MAQRDYYDILGVPRDADKKTLKDAYHRLAMKWHPDRNKAPDAEDRFKEIAKAYAVLSDPKKRARYDASGEEGVAHFTSDDLFRDHHRVAVLGDSVVFGFMIDQGRTLAEMLQQRIDPEVRHTKVFNFGMGGMNLAEVVAFLRARDAFPEDKDDDSDEMVFGDDDNLDDY